MTFFPRFISKNKKYWVLFTAININTRYAYAYKAKDKESNTIINFIKDMEKKTIINVLNGDLGSEFNNVELIEFCKDKGITLDLFKSDTHKLGIINRFHRTLKEKLNAYFDAHDTVTWIDIIDKIIDNYNNTVNRGIGYKPIEVNAFIENQIIQEKKEQGQNVFYTEFKI